MKRRPIGVDPTRCEVCGQPSALLRPRWVDAGLRCCDACVDLSPRELAEVYCKRIERRDG